MTNISLFFLTWVSSGIDYYTLIDIGLLWGGIGLGFLYGYKLRKRKDAKIQE